MGRLVFGMMQSLDGYIEGPKGGPGSPPSPVVFRHFIAPTDFFTADECMRSCSTGMRISRTGTIEHEYAQVWRSKPKWVASRSLTSVGPNATLVQGNVIDFAANIKSERNGEIEVAGAELANVLSTAGLIDEYRLYFRPLVSAVANPSSPAPCLRFA